MEFLTLMFIENNGIFDNDDFFNKNSIYEYNFMFFWLFVVYELPWVKNGKTK